MYHDMGLIGGMLAALTVPLPPGGGSKPMRAAPCVLMSPVDFLKDPLVWPRALSRCAQQHAPAPRGIARLTRARAQLPRHAHAGAGFRVRAVRVARRGGGARGAPRRRCA